MVQALDNLPSSDDKYWKDADVNKHTPVGKPEHTHFFVRVKGNSAECQTCRVGYVLVPGFEVKKGHIFEHGTLVI